MTNDTYQAAEKCVYTLVLAWTPLMRTTVPQKPSYERIQDSDMGKY